MYTERTRQLASRKSKVQIIVSINPFLYQTKTLQQQIYYTTQVAIVKDADIPVQ